MRKSTKAQIITQKHTRSITNQGGEASPNNDSSSSMDSKAQNGEMTDDKNDQSINKQMN